MHTIVAFKIVKTSNYQSYQKRSYITNVDQNSKYLTDWFGEKYFNLILFELTCTYIVIFQVLLYIMIAFDFGHLCQPLFEFFIFVLQNLNSLLHDQWLFLRFQFFALGVQELFVCQIKSLPNRQSDILRLKQQKKIKY